MSDKTTGDNGSSKFKILHCRHEMGFKLCEQWYAPDLFMPPHDHESPHFCAVLRGECAYAAKHGDAQVGSSDVVFVPADRIHSTTCSPDGVRLLILAPSEPWAARLSLSGPYREAPSLLQGIGAGALMRRLYRELRTTDKASTLAIGGLAMELLAEVTRQGSRQYDSTLPRWVRQIRELLDHSFQAPPPIEELARLADVPAAYLSRTFQRHVGCSPADYVRQLRISHAAKALASTRIPLAEVALEAGFYDQAHFCRTFKQVMGLTPSEYRKQSR